MELYRLLRHVTWRPADRLMSAGAAFSSPLRALNPFGFPQSLVSNRHPSEVTTKAYAFAVGRSADQLLQT